MEQDQSEQKKDYGQIFFSWSFSEFPQHSRSRRWYLGAAVLIVLMLIFSVVSRNILFTNIVILTALLLILFHRSNNVITFKITEDGILVNDRFFEYESLKNFFIIYQPPTVKTLYFEPKSFFNPRIPISLENQNPVQVREVLMRFLPEDIEREHEPVSDQIARLFKL